MIGTLDSQVIKKFKEFQEKTGKYLDLDIEDVEFEESFPFNDDENVILIGSKNIASHEELSGINDKNGLPVYDASSNINTYVDENKFPNQVFEVENNDNPDISFASEGNSSAGTNFIIHQNKYFVNNHRTVMKFTNKYYSKYIYYNIFRMKEQYGFKRGYTPSQKELKRLEIRIPIPKDYNEKYKSIDIQKVIVEFLEYSFDNLERIKSNIDKRYEIVSKMKKSLIPSTFKRTAIKNTFKKYAKENNIDFDITDIEFDIKRIHAKNKDEVICKKRMGFTPKTDNNGDINWFSVSDLTNQDGLYIDVPNSTKKTTMKLIKEQVDSNNTGKSEKLIPIKKGDILVSFKLTVGTVKIYNSDLPAYCNEAIDILTLDKDFDNRYIAYNCILEYSKYGTKTNNGITLNDDDKEKIRIFIPKDLPNYTSYKLQQILADFIEHMDKEIDEKYFKKYNRFYEVVELLRETYLKRTFSKIVWS
jgi:hypothetical protein